jgi:hypothetical protein
MLAAVIDKRLRPEQVGVLEACQGCSTNDSLVDSALLMSTTTSDDIALRRAQAHFATGRVCDCPRDPAISALEQFNWERGWLGRNAGPGLLLDWYYTKRLDPADVGRVILDIWSAAEYPLRWAPVGDWVGLFRDAHLPVPAGPLTIYRGASPGRRRGMSWTTSLEQARWFARRWLTRGPAVVVTVTAPPEAILAVFGEVDGRGEHEVIVDRRQLPPVHTMEKFPREGAGD